MSKPNETNQAAASCDTEERDDVSEGSAEESLLGALDALFATDSGESVADSLSGIAEALGSIAASFDRACERSNKTNKIICKLLGSIDDTLKKGSAARASGAPDDSEDDSTNGRT
jgi:hypothetical protein